MKNKPYNKYRSQKERVHIFVRTVDKEILDDKSKKSGKSKIDLFGEMVRDYVVEP